MNFSDRLDHAMRKAGYKSQNALAKASGVSQSTINRLLKTPGTTGPDAATIEKLAQACNVNFNWLKDGTMNDDKAKQPSEAEELFTLRLTLTEVRLVSQHRNATPAGKRLLEDMAANIDLAPPHSDDQP